MVSNVYNIPVYGKPIEPEDQGIFYAINRKTGGINNVFHLLYEDEEWYLYQLKNTGKEGEMGWVILAHDGDYPLKAITTEEVRYYFDKPEYAEPKGAWQIIRNARYGFGKFTPLHDDDSVRYAMILFSAENEMLMPLLIVKADDEILQSLAKIDG